MNHAREILIEELFFLFNRTRNYILHNIKGIENIAKAKEFYDVFTTQCLILWFLQQKKIFNDDNLYLITKFREISNGILSQHFNSYLGFITSLLCKITAHSDSYIYKDDIFGELRVLGPTLLLIEKKDLDSFHIPNHCLFDNEHRSTSINSFSKKQNDFLPIFNILETISQNRGNIDEFIIGAIYEKFINLTEKKRSGAYYTPEPISYYTSKTALYSYFIERINSKFSSNFELMIEVLKSRNKDVIIFLFELIKEISILDPAVGTGHFLESATKILLDIYISIWKNLKKFQPNCKADLEIYQTDGKKTVVDLVNISDENEFSFFVLFHILTNNIFGIDIDGTVIKIAKARLFLFLVRYFEVYMAQIINLMNISFNLKCGNSLIGFIYFPQEPVIRQLHLDKYFPEINKTNNDILLEDVKLLMRKDGHFIEREQIYYDLFSKFNTLFSQKYDIELYRLKKLNPLHWCLEFPHIFINKEGFNIIIANPPYLGESGNKNLFRDLSLCLDSYYEGKIDLWYLFLHRSLDLLTSEAYLSFITSNYWITASGAEKLRSRILSQTSIVNYVNFGENKAFSNAQGVHTNIFTLKKVNTPNPNIKVTLFMKNYPISTNLITKLDKQLNFKTDQTKIIFKDWDSYFHFLPEEYRVIFEYIISNSVMLKNEGFYTKEGIVTGLNNITTRQIRKYNLSEDLKGVGVFILNEKDERDLYLINTFNEEELALLKPFYKNSDIQRFSTAIRSHKKILYLNRNTVNLDNLPNIKKHLK
ncbi:MAG: Eco57I restriction-modification methylase domain-containing protein, partial [Candidatus Hodarchaeota archaeon]